VNLEQMRQKKRLEIALAGQEAYWACWTMEGVAPLMVKDFILSIAPQSGIALTQQQRDMRAAARDVVIKNRDLLVQVRNATTVEELEAISWT
jgi:hypothetical protein